MSDTISNFDDLVDSRDVISRIEELESDRQSLVDMIAEAEEELVDAVDDTSVIADFEPNIVDKLKEEIEESRKELEEWDESDDAEELEILKSLAEEASYSPDWAYGKTLIRDSYFEEYAQQLAEDIGAINREASWPNDCIDWSQAAEELQQDYSSVDFDGETYWIRS